jgi:predicted Mrr-cat superfamily restriction endonuclease
LCRIAADRCALLPPILVHSRATLDTDFAPASVASAAGQLFRFVHELRSGDFVVYPEPSPGPVHCGRVEGPYTYRKGNYPRHHSPIAPHLRAVTWHRELSRAAFTDAEHKALSARLTLSVLTLESLLRRCFPGA